MDVNDRPSGPAPRAPRACDYLPGDVTAESDLVPRDEERIGATRGRSQPSASLAESRRHPGDGLHLHRCVLRYRGRGNPPPEDLARIKGEVRVLDRTSRMVLVEASGPQVAGLVAALPRWVAAEEQSFGLAGGRPVSRRRFESDRSAR